MFERDSLLFASILRARSSSRARNALICIINGIFCNYFSIILIEFNYLEYFLFITIFYYRLYSSNCNGDWLPSSISVNDKKFLYSNFPTFRIIRVLTEVALLFLVSINNPKFKLILITRKFQNHKFSFSFKIEN